MSNFQSLVDQALQKVKTILDVTRHPTFAADVPHQYEDKYFLAQILVNTGLAAHLNWLEALGLSPESLGKLLSWVETRAVTLTFTASQQCDFDKMVERKEESKDEHVTTTKVLGITATSSSKVVTTIKEWFWFVSSSFELAAFPGTDVNDKVVILSSASKIRIKTTTENTPYPLRSAPPRRELDLTWFLQQIDPVTRQLRFAVNRDDERCRTPRRNPQVNAVFLFSARVSSFASAVCGDLHASADIDQPRLSEAALNETALFLPVLPLFEEREVSDDDASSTDSAPTPSSSSSSTPSSSSTSSGSGSGLVVYNATQSHSNVTLSVADVNALLAHQRQTLQAKFAEFDAVYPDRQAMLNPCSARVRLCALHARSIGSQLQQALEAIEEMLTSQLIAAIGKILTPADFAAFMRFHNRKLFHADYQPRPFCYAIRRPEHYPEGTLAIEAQASDGAIAEPVLTSVRRVEPVTAMRFPISAATDVVFNGQRFLHSWIDTNFQGGSGQSLSLVARARQFSSFILLVGRVASASLFQPSAAIIIQNRDELAIPLMLEQLPTPKEFRDAIESLSPEQRRFCQAYRAMQLESTLFAVCVIQIKPQLERLLCLPEDALTKEIKLTQDLMDLFLTYQIPSDLLSYDGPEAAPVEAKVACVKDYVARILQMIADMKQAELQEAAQKAAAAILAAPPPPCPAPVMMESSISPRGGGGMMLMRSAAAPAPRKMMMSAAPPPSAPSFSAPPPPPPSAPSVSAPPPPRPSAQPSVSQAATSTVVKQAKPAKPQQQGKKGTAEDEQEATEEDAAFDFTRIPHELDRKFERLDLDSALRPTIIKMGKVWTKKFHASLLSKQSTTSVSGGSRKDEKNRAYDLLDSLSRSGALPVEDAELHVVLAATHCFDKSVINTIVQDNVNPIEKVERSLLIVSSTIQNKPVKDLVNPDQLARIHDFNGHLLL